MLEQAWPLLDRALPKLRTLRLSYAGNTPLGKHLFGPIPPVEHLILRADCINPCDLPFGQSHPWDPSSSGSLRFPNNYQRITLLGLDTHLPPKSMLIPLDFGGAGKTMTFVFLPRGVSRPDKMAKDMVAIARWGQAWAGDIEIVGLEAQGPTAGPAAVARLTACYDKAQEAEKAAGRVTKALSVTFKPFTAWLDGQENGKMLSGKEEAMFRASCKEHEARWGDRQCADRETA